MPARSLTPTPKTYAELREAVRAVVAQGRRDIDRAWLATYHETGRLINEHVLRFRDRADYGAKTYLRLAADTGISPRTLQECAQFHRCFPIARTCAQLGWAQCRLLCQVADAEVRAKLLTQATKHGWTVAELGSQVRTVNAAEGASAGGEAKEISAPVEPVALLNPRRGTPGLHPIVDRGDGPAVDLGFKLYRELGAAATVSAKDIVRLTAAGVRKVEGATKAELFTYAATVRRVVDGDTLVVALGVAPGITLELTLRLRGLDCPEVSTAAGRAAKRFVEGVLRAGDTIVVSTMKPDKYDRYLADVFIRSRTGEDAGGGGPPAETFLNNALLEQGHAVRYDGAGPKEET